MKRLTIVVSIVFAMLSYASAASAFCVYNHLMEKKEGRMISFSTGSLSGSHGAAYGNFSCDIRGKRGPNDTFNVKIITTYGYFAHHTYDKTICKVKVYQKGGYILVKKNGSCEVRRDPN